MFGWEGGKRGRREGGARPWQGSGEAILPRQGAQQREVGKENMLPSMRDVGAGARAIGDKNMLQRRIPKNNKYDNVKSQVDTGMTAQKAAERAESGDSGRHRRGELFRRIRPTTFARMVADDAVDYLLLDLRQVEAFEQGHVRGAMSYPSALLSHSVHPFSREVLMYKNREGSIVVVYDDDERIGAPAAAMMYEKGIDNVYLLTGGIRALGEVHPELIEGEIPRPPSAASSTRSVTRKYHGGSGGGGDGLRQLPSYGSVRSLASFASGVSHHRPFRM